MHLQVFKWAKLGLFAVLFKLFYIKIVDSFQIRFRIIIVEGEHTDHLTTTITIAHSGTFSRALWHSNFIIETYFKM